MDHRGFAEPGQRSLLDTWYRYHREGLDRLSKLETQQQAKQSVANAVLALRPIHTRQPNIYLIRWFFDSKSVEIQQVFSGGPAVQLQDVSDALQVMDPSNASKYLAMGKSR